jgi:hypothetical protein
MDEGAGGLGFEGKGWGRPAPEAPRRTAAGSPWRASRLTDRAQGRQVQRAWRGLLGVLGRWLCRCSIGTMDEGMGVLVFGEKIGATQAGETPHRACQETAGDPRGKRMRNGAGAARGAERAAMGSCGDALSLTLACAYQ